MGNLQPSRSSDVVVFANAAELAVGAADHIARFIEQQAIDSPATRAVTVAMAGGSTPVATYRCLSVLDVPWERVCAWVGDERYVPPNHPASNGSMIERRLLGDTPARFLPVPWEEDCSPARAAALYEKQLLEVMAHDAGGPRPDLVLVGMGGDGHTLSLFPGSPALDTTDRWYVAVRVDDQHAWRLTATLPLVHRARRIYVLVAGEGKAAALAEVLQPTSDAPLPARRLMEGRAPVTWLVDEAAASLLT